jgi:hypothetical protein
MTITSEDLATILLAEQDSLTNLLRLLKEEQQVILQRRTDVLVNMLTAIEEQLLRVRHQQAEREQTMKSLISQSPLPERPHRPGLAFRVTLLPENMREACLPIAQRIDTLNQLVYELAWQNHVLLSRSVHFLQEVLAPLLGNPNGNMTVYGNQGTVRKGNKAQNLFQAVA